jgi:predicted dehydrogenase
MHRILVAGVGSIGERHLRCLKATGRADLGICEINDPLRTSIAARYQLPVVYSDLESALGDAWDAVVIATPAHLHVKQMKLALRRGLHVLVEKPLGTSLRGVDTLIREVEESGRVVAVAYVHRTHPAVTSMRKALLDGAFGVPLQVTVVSGQHFPFYRPDYRRTYYADRATGGGVIQDALCHLVNAVEWLVGPASWVAADSCHKALDGVEVEDTVTAIARHGDVLASYSLNQYQAPNETCITVVAERGTLRFELHNCRWLWMRDPGGEWTEEAFGPMERDELFTLQEQAFLDAVEGKGEVLCSVREASQTLRVTLAMMKSSDRGARPVPLKARASNPGDFS